MPATAKIANHLFSIAKTVFIHNAANKESDMRTRLVHSILIFFCLIALCACGGGSTKQRKAAEPAAPAFTIDRAYHEIIVADVELALALRGNYPLVAGQLEDALLSQLRSKSFFTKVGKERDVPVTGDTLIVDVNITDMRVVSGAARFWGGAMAGSSYINVVIELKDAVSGKVIHRKDMSSANNAFGAAWTGGSTDKTLPSDMGRISAEYVVSVIPKQ